MILFDGNWSNLDLPWEIAKLKLKEEKENWDENWKQKTLLLKY